ncbi:MAG: ferrous iron transporter B [Firmicutes bacterium]|nr:ferrous iron transporter B [Bacillota bacterium]
MSSFTIALAGNPNVGKSSIFNCLTGLHQHTGNWPGKTVSNARGTFSWRGTDFTLVDLPGIYSLRSGSVEEEIARDYIKSGEADCVVCVADATCLERSLNLILQIYQLTPRLIVCVNLLDEAEKKHIRVDLTLLSRLLHVPVIGTCAHTGRGLTELKDTLYRLTRTPAQHPSKSVSIPEDIPHHSRFLFRSCVTFGSKDPHRRDRRLDRILTSPMAGYPLMLALLCLIFWLTIAGANVPSRWLTHGFSQMEGYLRQWIQWLSLSSTTESLLMDGLYATVSWVVSVMLPPMAIFFPLFTLLEDSGYLPRIAFNLDHWFQRCGAHGKQALTTCMGFGCNACAVTGCRIIESPRERMIAILTNSMIPCNGKFAGLIAIVTIFFSGTSGNGLLCALLMTGLILFCFCLTLVLSKLLSCTLLQGLPSTFALELPPYRRPQFRKVILRSILDRTVFVLGRAVVVAAPAGILLWSLNHIGALPFLISLLDPLGQFMGLDGVILTAFLLGFPANELVIPIVLMLYRSTGVLADYASLTELATLLTAHGWTHVTALCFLLFSTVHFPCGTTILTIQKETKSLKWTFVSILLPTLLGCLLCSLINAIL